MSHGRMQIAIVGGGAAGMVSARLLDDAHDVTVFERDAVVGGHVRTLGGNVACPGLPEGLRLDAGVIEFDRVHFPRFHALMEELGVEMASVPATSGMFLADGSSWHAPERLKREYPGLLHRSLEIPRHLPLLAARTRFLARVDGVPSSALREMSVDDFLEDDVFGTWLRMLLMYAYSIPYRSTGAIGATLAIPMLRRFVNTSDWTRVVGGVWTYLETICNELRGEVVTGATVVRVRRGRGGAEVTVEGQAPRHFDAVVFATTPDQVLAVLEDADEDERRRFSAWQPNRVHTLTHTDTALYERRDIRYHSEFDLFETAGGAHGYNAHLNRLCGVEEGPPHYNLAYGIDEEIDPRCVLHTQHYVTPGYTVEALRWREEVITCNGQRETWFAGAWLGDGLHEGAVVSAERVAGGLGGRGIRGRVSAEVSEDISEDISEGGRLDAPGPR
ncbi:MAG: FAD-dependent oxidoreductase [Candidatus Binatia bacterium]